MFRTISFMDLPVELPLKVFKAVDKTGLLSLLRVRSSHIIERQH